MERALYIDNRCDSVEMKNLKTYDRIYFGNEFCDIHLPSKQQIDQITNISSLPLTLVFPILSETAFKNAVELIEYVNEADVNVDEIVFGDWGLYYYIISRNIDIRPVAGRILCKNKRDIRMNDFDRSVLLTKQGIDALTAPTEIHYVEYYNKLNIDRMEVDSSCSSLTERISDISITIWQPWNILAVGRICPFANHWKTYKITTVCNAECIGKKVIYVIHNNRHSSAVRQYGNAILYKAVESHPINCDRVVYYASSFNHFGD